MKTLKPSGNSLTTLVVNPSAGRGKAGRVLPRVMQELFKGLPEGTVKVIRARSQSHAEEACRTAVEAAASQPAERRDALVVMGGDGMMHLGLNAAAQTGVPLGAIPAGTGNDFCRGVGLPLNPVAAARVIAGGHTKAIDLSSVTGRLARDQTHEWVGCVVSTGYDARVSRRGNAMPQFWGSLAYALAALRELKGFKPLPYRLVIDGQERQLKAMFIAIANVPYFGGGMKIAPHGRPTDGRLDLMICHPVSRLTLIRLLPTMFTGRFVKDPACEFLEATEVVVDGDGLYGMADGEALGQVPLLIKVVPGALTLFAPPDRPLSRWRKPR
ncbi:MAG: diacylglycerol kinase family lipid kinase [Propionibacteriaceae bacterium]|jgi:diacylglycerol kinase (ATP)|nr:diacylglycerol kinase family lipid kinase [Propionibacteriaceae bacterium]